jgi:hypothetical protein
VQRYNGTASDEDAPVAVAVNESLNVYVGEKKNPKLSLYNNHLLGELMMLQLNIAASDAEITPLSFGSIIYDDTIPPIITTEKHFANSPF